jgi:cytochrome P450
MIWVDGVRYLRRIYPDHEAAFRNSGELDAIGPGNARQRAGQRAGHGARQQGRRDKHRKHPDGSVLSNLANDDAADVMTDAELATRSLLLLVAGHETTVNLTANGILTLLRHPWALERLRGEPDWATAVVEELLRYEPPVQYLPNRIALADIEVDGTTIRKGERVTLLLAAASRDPQRFASPDRFNPDRPDNQHMGFGSGLHYCFGAPLARIEAQISLTAMARRLSNPRLTSDPPPYRPSPVLRGPVHLPVRYDDLAAD